MNALFISVSVPYGTNLTPAEFSFILPSFHPLHVFIHSSISCVGEEEIALVIIVALC